MFFCIHLDYFIPVLLAFVVLGLVSSVPSQEIDWEERLRNDLFCVEWDVKTLTQSINNCDVHFVFSSNIIALSFIQFAR